MGRTNESESSEKWRRSSNDTHTRLGREAERLAPRQAIGRARVLLLIRYQHGTTRSSLHFHVVSYRSLMWLSPFISWQGSCWERGWEFVRSFVHEWRARETERRARTWPPTGWDKYRGCELGCASYPHNHSLIALLSWRFWWCTRDCHSHHKAVTLKVVFVLYSCSFRCQLRVTPRVLSCPLLSGLHREICTLVKHLESLCTLVKHLESFCVPLHRWIDTIGWSELTPRTITIRLLDSYLVVCLSLDLCLGVVAACANRATRGGNALDERVSNQDGTRAI